MYEILCRSPERTAPAADEIGVGAQSGAPHSPLILHMQENRSHLPDDARGAVAALALALMAASILPVLKGLLFVPLCAIGALAVLTFALEHHARSTPASETLELVDGLIRHSDSTGRAVEIPARRIRLATVGRAEADLRLFLQSRDGRVEVGKCLALEERREVAALVSAALAQAQASAGGLPAWA